MSWDKSERKYWDVGEEILLTLTDKRLAKVMSALVQCDGKVHDIHCGEKKWGEPVLTQQNRFCCALLRISLPQGAEEDFEVISEQILTEPARVGL